jgi:hypothetical protein
MLMRPITSEKLELFASVFPPPYDSEYARYWYLNVLYDFIANQRFTFVSSRSQMAISFFFTYLLNLSLQRANKLHGLSPQVNYTDRAPAACRRS